LYSISRHKPAAHRREHQLCIRRDSRSSDISLWGIAQSDIQDHCKLRNAIMSERAGSDFGNASDPSVHFRERDGISLVDIWLVLLRRRITLLAIVFSTVAAAGAFSFVSKPIYESRAVLEIGKVGGLGGLEEVSAVVRWIREEYALDNPEGHQHFPRIDSVDHSPKTGQNILIITARDRSAEGAHSFVTGVAARLIGRHRKLYDEGRTAQEARLHELELEIVALKNQASLLGKLTKQLDDRGQAAVVAVELSGLLGTLSALRSQRTSLALALSAVQSYPTRLVGQPIPAQKPVRPRPVLFLLVGVVAGLLLGLFAVFFAEIVSSARREMTVRQGEV
jgi:uncharacterized protein involved in exopolysaccharide biosynthesis